MSNTETLRPLRAGETYTVHAMTPDGWVVYTAQTSREARRHWGECRASGWYTVLAINGISHLGLQRGMPQVPGVL
jgi:hypothetical protein